MHSNNTQIILFLYGGGMRGLIPAHFMSRIEEVTGLRMAEMVDIFCGPSTGSILNAALNIPSPDNPLKPRFRARHMIRFYEREGIKIFPQDRFREFRGFIHDFNNRTMKIGQLNNLMRQGHYDTKHLKRSLRSLYGDVKLSHSLQNLVIPVYNIDGESLYAVTEEGETEQTPVHTKNNFIDEGGHALWLKNIRYKKNFRPVQDVSLFDAVMASCSAPTYFPSHHFQATYHRPLHTLNYTGIDGSIFDNPCISYHGAIRQHLEPDTNVIMITLGTGYKHKSISKDQWDSYGGLGVVDPVNDLPLINILFHASESALVESFTQEMGDNLYMFNKSMNTMRDRDIMPNEDIDDASPENLKALEHFAHEMIEENKMRFLEVCHHLVRNYEIKSKERDSFFKRIKRRFYMLRS